MSKPWLELNLDVKNAWWSLSNNSSSSYDKCPIAYFVIQDSNMHGSYFRYFKWFQNDANRYLEVSPNWYFDIPMKNMKNNIKIFDKNGCEFKVIDKFSNEFVKILEKI